MTPKARSATIDVATLSPLAAFAFAHADGSRSVADLADLATSTGEAMFRALDELADRGLLETRVAPPAGRSTVRRPLAQPNVASAEALGVAPGVPLWASDASKEEHEKRKTEQDEKKAGRGEEHEKRKTEESDKRGTEESDKRGTEESDKRSGG